MVCPARIERATYGLEGRCSIQLSYGQKYLAKNELKRLPLLTQGQQGAALCRVYRAVSMSEGAPMAQGRQVKASMHLFAVQLRAITF